MKRIRVIEQTRRSVVDADAGAGEAQSAGSSASTEMRPQSTSYQQAADEERPGRRDEHRALDSEQEPQREYGREQRAGERSAGAMRGVVSTSQQGETVEVGHTGTA